MSAVKFIIFILFLIVISMFATMNMATVEISYYDFQLESQTITLPIIVTVLGPFATGFILAWVLDFISKLGLMSDVRRQRKTIRRLEDELEKLKGPTEKPADNPAPAGKD